MGLRIRTPYLSARPLQWYYRNWNSRLQLAKYVLKGKDFISWFWNFYRGSTPRCSFWVWNTSAMVIIACLKQAMKLLLRLFFCSSEFRYALCVQFLLLTYFHSIYTYSFKSQQLTPRRTKWIKSTFNSFNSLSSCVLQLSSCILCFSSFDLWLLLCFIVFCILANLSYFVRKVFRFAGYSDTGDDHCGGANALVLSAVFF